MAIEKATDEAKEKMRVSPPGYLISGEPIRAGDLILGTQYSIRNPSTYGSYGAGFGDTISDIDREWLSQREPISRFFVYYMAGDVFKNWFELDDPRTESPDEAFDRKVQKRLKEVNAHEEMRKALEWERLYGVSFLVGRFDDAKDSAGLMTEKAKGAKLEKLYSYNRKAVNVTVKELDPNSDRYGEPLVYSFDRGAGFNSKVFVHYTRVIKLSTTSDLSSVIDIIYDDQTSYRNIRWALAQTIWRIGSGFPVLTLNNYTPEMLKTAKEENLFGNLMARTYGLLNQDMKLEFIGAQQSSLNPAPYVEPLVKNISTGTRIPKPVLEGAQAGALTGSEVNALDYWSAIATIQMSVEPSMRQVIDWIVEGDNIGIEDYDMEWPTGYEPTPMEQSQMDYLKEQTNNLKLNYMYMDEVREENGLLPVGATEENPEGTGEGKVILGLKKLSMPNPFGSSPFEEKPKEEEKTEEEEKEGGKTLFDSDEVKGQIQNHDALTKMLQVKFREIIDGVLHGGLQRDDAMKAAEVLVKRQMALEEASIVNLLEVKLKRNLYALPVEGRAELDRRYAKYIDYFQKILDDALVLAGKVSK